MAKHIYRKLTPAELERSQKVRAQIEKELPELIAKGQAIFERHERLQAALSALKAEREKQGLTLADMESRTGISKAALSRLENAPNPNPTINTLMRIAQALGREITIKLSAPNEAA